MKDNFRLIYLDKSIRYSLLISVLILTILTLVLLFVYTKLPPVIPLFNSLVWGSERLANRLIIFVIPISLILIGVINVILSRVAYKRRALLSRMLSLNLLLVVVLSAVAFIQILFLVL